MGVDSSLVPLDGWSGESRLDQYDELFRAIYVL